MHILAINPGSTSTKIAVYEDDTLLHAIDIAHSRGELAPFERAIDQYDFRKQLIFDELAAHHISLNFDAVVGRGPISKAVPSGVYAVNEQMIDDNRHSAHDHPCNLGCILAYDIARTVPCPAYIVDPGVVDELAPVARITGLPEMPHYGVWHALNQKAVARRHAREHGKRYEDLQLIVCHMGGGISVAAHDHGLAVDANNALDGEGPFTTERAGSLPVGDLIRMCFSGKYKEEELMTKIRRQSGMYAYLGSNDMRVVGRRVAEGDEQAKLVVDAMVYNIAKWICAEAAVFGGKVDAILLTGGLAHSDYVTSGVRERVQFLAPVYCYPGEDEMLSLAEGALAALKGEREVLTYR